MKTALKNFRESNTTSTQVQVADKANISERVYQKYEAGECIPNIYTAIRIAKALNTKVEKIFPLSSDTNPIYKNNTTKQEK